MIEIDGSFGEGGGQILRTSLALSLITETAVRLKNIRVKRQKPGLRRQHLTAVRAAAEVGSAHVTGDAVGSTEIEFRPRKVIAGEYNFSIGTAGSTSLVFQTVLPPLMLAQGHSRVVFEGGTHNTGAPPFDFIKNAFIPLINRMGAQATASLEKHGFVPAGGGKWSVDIDGGRKLSPLTLHERGFVRRRTVRALLSHLSEDIGQRELQTVREKLKWADAEYRIDCVDAAGPGNALLIEVESDFVTEVFIGFGQRGVPAEKVAASAVDCAKTYLSTRGAVGEYLADQLMLPLALAGGGSYTTVKPTLHATTNAEVIQRFLPMTFRFNKHADTCSICVHASSHKSHT